MRNFSRIILLSVCVGFSVTVFADTKIAVIDQVAVLTQSAQAKVMVQKMKNDTAADEQKLKTMGAALEKTSKQLETDSAVMSEAQRQKSLKDFEKKRADFFELQQKLQKRYQDGQQNIVQVMTPKVKQVLEQIVKKGGYDVVIQRQALVYVGPGLDITAAVISAMDAAGKK